MNYHYSPFAWNLQPETWSNMRPNPLVSASTQAADPWAQSILPLVGRSDGGILGSLTPRVGGILGLPPVGPWPHPPTTDSKAWDAPMPSARVLSPAAPGSWVDPDSDVMATSDDEFCKRIRNMCIAQCSDTSLPSGNYEFSFWNCVNKCMQRYGCPTVRG
jgi:hypothetical protein